MFTTIDGVRRSSWSWVWSEADADCELCRDISGDDRGDGNGIDVVAAGFIILLYASFSAAASSRAF